MQQNIREPKQKRAIEKKESLINAAFQLFNEKGFYNTNSKEIAKKAGVSTGLFYNYFNDKSDIFLEILNRISEKNYLELEKILEKLSKENDKKQLLKSFFIENIKLLSELAFIYKDIETIKKEYEEIGKYRDKNKQRIKILMMSFFNKINDEENIKNLDIKWEIIQTTIDANYILISKLENKDDKLKFIDEMVCLIYNYMF
ncbi:TetR/AcrR family transcriptional regulator [Romboutsia sp.]|uniref:TetR/AcrR family transcriptional regulator n=1 Tax=Romboutsia sp. TaxID=1965302 RepID=UPI002C7881D1|nr:TetR/AcrR family transcriptional regulator [Romboutsia sp.]HSQ89820.1 TetR/AcrR family transcriptional regulator [Romboutsia sp.]